VKIKISEEDLENTDQNPLELFYQGIRAEATRDKYTRTLRRIVCDILEDVLQGSFEERVIQLANRAKADPNWGLSILLTISRKQKERTKLDTFHPDYLNPVSFDNTFKPLKKLFDMNDVPIVWKRVYATFPENNNNNSSSRGYTREEIHKMLNFAKGSMDRAIILVAASSGIRPGAMEFKWEDITPVYKIDNKIVLEITESQVSQAEIICAMITIYRKTYAEIPAFITSEAYHALLDWKKVWITEVGREPKEGEPVFKRSGPFAIQSSAEAIKRRIERVLEGASLLPPLAKGMRRREVPAMYGFRRFFNKINKETISKDSPLAALIKKEFMMDHTGLVSLDRNYFKTHIIELIEEYLNAAPNLTISNEERIRAENRKLRKEKSELELKDKENKKLREDVDALQLKIERMMNTKEKSTD
jgi:hypothetical protein